MAGQRSSSSSSSFSFTYDVFLSFNGSDTRFGFTGHLSNALDYSGIHTFMDDKELRKGDEITTTILEAIKESRIAIIVFSENYASSSFCLDVLASILDNFQRKGMLILPVFYGVDPSDVRHQRGTYDRALEMHEEKLKDNNQKVQKWRNALHQVANLSGLHYRHGDDYEFRLIEEIVREVSRKINRTILHVADYPVGLESRLKEVQLLLGLESNGESNGALMVGIHGVGGIGKTTLARAIYNMIAHQFEASCFLSCGRENSNINGLVHLQNMLLFEMIGLKDIHLRNSDDGALKIKHWLHRKKVLLILDDVNTIEQLEALVGGSNWFGSGSRVIITTRDRHLLAFHRVERTYEVQALNHQDSLELLSHQVFKQGNFDPRHTEILNKLVSYASGLPMALRVIGSYLFKKNVDEWANALHRFKRIPLDEIQMSLETNFDVLREDEQSVFLDIACCFKGYKKERALDILCAHHGYNVEFHIEVLINKSLVSISSDGNVTLHPLIEDMGKEIVRRESLEPGERSRLWFPEDIIHVLENNTGTSTIAIIHLDSSLIGEEIKWDGEAFKKMENLRTLIVKRYHFSEAPKYLPNSLRVLEWWIYPSQKLPSDFNPEQLVIHNLPNMGAMSVILARLTKTSPSDPEVLQISISYPGFSQTSLQRVYEDNKTWKNVGLVSSVVGLLCCALSPSFNRLIRGWNSLKLFLYGVLSLVIFTTIFIAKKSSPKQHVLQKLIGFAVLMFIAVYTLYYDRAVNGKPDILGLVSNAAFALVSLSLSKLIKFGHEVGIFSFFLSCLAGQLWTINWKLILIAIVFGCPLFVMHSSSNSGHSSSDS